MAKTQATATATEVVTQSKRKRDIIPEDEDDKLEIDVNLPEPPSKKAKRKEKKLQKKPTVAQAEEQEVQTEDEATTVDKSDVKPEKAAPATTEVPAAAKRSDYAVWIGNLPFKTTKDNVRQFFRDQGGIDNDSITRVHMPTGEKGQNKGFAYVDFDTPAVLAIALSLSEKLIVGRRCLIKDAKSFEGRPAKAEKADGKTGGGVSEKEPSKRVFVGNLGFDITKDELAEHFGQAGEVEDIFMATFEDTGKCKGFGWVTFANIDAATNAVRGYVFKDAEKEKEDESEEEAEDEDDTQSSKKRKEKKPRKWFINRIGGRTLRCEYAEDAQTRYKKRFGKGSNTGQKSEQERGDAITDATTDAPTAERRPRKPKLDKDGRQEERRKKFDARKIAPGKALANAPRASGAIVQGAGTKISFD